MVHKTLYKAARAIKMKMSKFKFTKKRKNTWNILGGFLSQLVTILGDEAAL